MKSLVLAEKPSVGRDLARVLNCHQRNKRYIEGEKYVVTWALGHLVELCEPQDYEKGWKRWDLSVLPMIPAKMKLRISKKTAPQFNAIKKLFARKDIQQLIIATDAGREGELVARWIMMMAGWKGKPVKRLWISSQTNKAIKTGFANLQSSRNYDQLFQAARCRAEADWIIGLNITRALTCKFDTQLNAGRVQTPTLSLLVDREKEIRDFEPKDFWHLKIDFGFFTALWTDENGNSRIFCRDKALSLKKKLKNATPKIIELDKSEKSDKPPLAYDLTELQMDANIKYNHSAKQTLNIMQNLYERLKLVSYPRTDSKYITQDLVATIPERLQALASTKFSRFSDFLLKREYVPTKRFVDDEKVTDHHAILPTETPPNYRRMSDSEINIYELIVQRFIAVLSPDHKYLQFKLKIDLEGEIFTAHAKKVIEPGWKAIEKNSEPHSSALANISATTKLEIKSINIKKDKTTPPARFSEATLLAAMENPSKYLIEKELKDAIKSGGLGTPATRADIIDKLVKKYYIERKGNSLSPTSKAEELLKLVPRQFKHPDLTGKWEQQLSEISQGNESAENFMNSIKENIKSLVNQVKSSQMKFKPHNLTEQICPQCGEYLLAVKKRGRNILSCSNRHCRYESTGTNNNHLQAPGRRRKKSQAVQKYGKNKGFESSDTLGDLFDF